MTCHKDPSPSDNKVSCDARSNFQEKLNIKSTSEEFVQADDALPSSGELDLDEACDNVSSNTDELDIDGLCLSTCSTCSEAMQYFKSMNIICKATQMSHSM
jgi:hypothetical protein